jgi:hypothetical protein
VVLKNDDGFSIERDASMLMRLCLFLGGRRSVLVDALADGQCVVREVGVSPGQRA